MAQTCERFSRIMQINVAIKTVIHRDFSSAFRMLPLPDREYLKRESATDASINVAKSGKIDDEEWSHNVSSNSEACQADQRN